MLLSNSMRSPLATAVRCSCTPRLAAPSLSISLRALSTAPAPTLHPTDSGLHPPHLLTLADLSVSQIQTIVSSALAFKKQYQENAVPGQSKGQQLVKEKSLESKTVALMFSKRSTRTRVASETAVQLLGESRGQIWEQRRVHRLHRKLTRCSQIGGHPMFLGSNDIQLGVNESLYDTSRVVSSMVDGIMARVGHHSEVEVRSRRFHCPCLLKSPDP